MVVAEGAEEGLINPNERISKEVRRDGSGNLIYDDILLFMERAVADYARDNHQLHCNITAIDPTYAIRSVAANAGDT